MQWGPESPVCWERGYRRRDCRRVLLCLLSTWLHRFAFFAPGLKPNKNAWIKSGFYWLAESVESVGVALSTEHRSVYNTCIIEHTHTHTHTHPHTLSPSKQTRKIQKHTMRKDGPQPWLWPAAVRPQKRWTPLYYVSSRSERWPQLTPTPPPPAAYERTTERGRGRQCIWVPPNSPRKRTKAWVPPHTRLTFPPIVERWR